MDVDASLTTTADPDTVFDHLSDLATYPQWLDIVATAVPLEPDPGGEPVWSVDLRGQVGPLRRSKRLRMVRRRADRPSSVVFERAEVDGRRHSAWIMTSTVEAGADGTDVNVSLHYGGQMWIPMLDRLLADEIGRSRRTLGVLLDEL